MLADERTGLSQSRKEHPFDQNKRNGLQPGLKANVPGQSLGEIVISRQTNWAAFHKQGNVY